MLLLQVAVAASLCPRTGAALECGLDVPDRAGFFFFLRTRNSGFYMKLAGNEFKFKNRKKTLLTKYNTFMGQYSLWTAIWVSFRIKKWPVK